MRQRRCLIGIVAYRGVDSPVLESYMAWAFHIGRRCPDFEFILRVVGKKEQFRARNNLIAMAKAVCTEENDLLLMLDDDHELPPMMFEKMVKALDERPDAGIMGAFYWQRSGTHRPVIMDLYQKNDAYAVRWITPNRITGEVEKVGITGGGCLLFPMRSIMTLDEPYFWVDGIMGTDIHICLQLQNKGWSVYCHTGLELGHWDGGRMINHKSIPSHIKKYSEYSKDLIDDACEYFGLNYDQFQQEQAYALSRFEEIWNQKERQEFSDIIEPYYEIGQGLVLRNVYYATADDSSIDYFSNLQECIDRGFFKNNVLVYGCGIGIEAELLAKAGISSDAMDIAPAVLRFLDWRIKKRNFGHLIKSILIEKEMPVIQSEYSNLIMLDVIEHLPNPHEILDMLFKKIKPGGYFFTNFHIMNYKGKEEGYPQHLKRITIPELETVLRNHRFCTVGNYLFRKEN